MTHPSARQIAANFIVVVGSHVNTTTERGLADFFEACGNKFENYSSKKSINIYKSPLIQCFEK